MTEEAQAAPAVETGGAEEYRTLDQVVEAHIRHALATARGNKVHASRLLGISRWALQRKMGRYGITARRGEG